ncbi:MAG: hypothetical protein GKC04_05455 [Methanomicrobiales archaeon]|nr:hypothetical protein [Methanomicrobiales archaeon]
MTGSAATEGLLAAAPVRLPGRTIIPVVLRRAFSTGGSVFYTATPVAICIVEADAARLVFLAGEEEGIQRLPAAVLRLIREEQRDLQASGG